MLHASDLRVLSLHQVEYLYVLLSLYLFLSNLCSQVLQIGLEVDVNELVASRL